MALLTKHRKTEISHCGTYADIAFIVSFLLSLTCIKMHPAMYWAYTSLGCEETCCIFFYVAVMYCVCVFFFLRVVPPVWCMSYHLVCPSADIIVAMCILKVVHFISYKYICVYSVSCSFIRCPRKSMPVQLRCQFVLSLLYVLEIYKLLLHCLVKYGNET